MTSCGQSISLQNMSNSDKLALIQSEAIPFRTLLIMSGHVMLYLGDSNSQAIMFQQFWGGSFINTGSSISFISKEAEITYVDMSIQGEGSATLTALTNMVIIGGSGQNTEGNTISSNTSNLNISGGSVVNITTSSVKSDQIDNASMIKTPNFVEASAPLHINKSVIKKICDINLRSVLFYSMVPYKNSINAVSMKTQSTLLLSSN